MTRARTNAEAHAPAGAPAAPTAAAAPAENRQQATGDRRQATGDVGAEIGGMGNRLHEDVPVAEAPPAVEAQPMARVLAPAHEGRGKRRVAAGHPQAAEAPAAATEAAPPAKSAAVTEAAAAAPPAARAPRDVLTEAERLLGQGEVAEACARGEDANRLAPKSAPVHKFLGKCYMRAGRTREANDNYRQYLELAPGAPDAPFVKSMIK
jgi:tetratricopeptide (TPR) repeat protein